MLTRNRLGLPQLAQKHLDRDDAPVRRAAHRRDGRCSRLRGQGTIHPGAFLGPWGVPQPSLPAEGLQGR